MRPKLFLLSLIAAITTWCSASFAQQQTAIGPGITPLNALGVLNGVAMSASGATGTLSVGVVGGPEMDIFTSNTALATVPPAVSTAASSQGSIVFNSSSTVNGNIGVTQPGGPFLLNLSGGNAGTTVNFLGSVFATTLNVTGTGAVNFNSGATNITATNFAADGTIGLAPNTTLIGALTTNTDNTGTLSLAGGSALTGAVGGPAATAGLKAINVVGGSNTAGVSASISGAVNAYSFSLGTNTLNIGGALTIADQGPSGVINTTLASPSVFGNIRVVGATNLGPALGVNVTVPSTAVIPVGTQFNIVQTQTGTVQSGTNGTVVTPTVVNPTNPLYAFTAVPPAGTVAGLVAITTTRIPAIVPIVITPAPTPSPIPVPIPVPAPTPTPPVVVVPVPPVVIPVAPPLLPVAIPIAPIIVGIIPTLSPTAPIIPLIAAINALTTPAAVINAEAQLAPSAPDLAAPLVTFQAVQQFQNLWLSRLDAVMCDLANQPLDQASQPYNASSTCQQNDPRGGWWVKGFGYYGSQSAENAFAGYNAGIYGTMIGYDAPIGSGTRAGLGFGYARSNIDGQTFSANTDTNTYQTTAYISHEDGPWFVQGDLSFGWNDYMGTRNVSFPGFSATANANYSGQSYTGFISTGYRFFTNGFTLTPLASLQYTHLNLDNYSETGAASIGLNVNSQNYDFLESGLGAKVAYPFVYGDGTYVPDVHFKWLYDLDNPSVKNTAAFAAANSPSFTTPGFKEGDSTVDLGAGLTFLSCGCTARTWSLEAVYDHYWRTNGYSADQGMIKATVRF
jgi:outer membrane autotransporter protein